VLPGDYTRNNLTDAADYTTWRDSEGLTSGAVFTQGDGNGDGAVNAADHTIWSSNYGQNWTNW
jgi:hypothetical protein